MANGSRRPPDGTPTPCPKYTLGDLLDHVGGLTVAFTMAAEKSPDALASSGTVR